MGNTTQVRIAGTHLFSHSRSLVIVGGGVCACVPLANPVHNLFFSTLIWASKNNTKRKRGYQHLGGSVPLGV